MTPKQLALAGELLWGKDWRSHLADLSDYPEKSVALWVKGSHPIPVPVQKDVKRLLERKRIAFDRLMDQLDLYAAN
jgi:hypothetical protein